MMKVLLFMVAAFATTESSENNNSGVIESIKNLIRGKNKSKVEKLEARIRQSFNHKKSRREDSIEEVNMKSGIANTLFQGDMLLSKDQQDEVIEDIGAPRSKRQAYNDNTYPGRRWPEGVFYSLDGNLAEDLLLVFKERGCWAEVGRQEGWQLLSLGEGCDQDRIAVHELGHALGFWHTHARHDRDQFITVDHDNVERGRLSQFVPKTTETNNNYNLTYDYGSVMHYGATSFANVEDGRLTLVPKDVNYTETLGSPFIAFYDILMMNMYYNCTDACKHEQADEKCSNGGFAHPRNCSKCICPSGYGGQFCDERPAGCGEILNATEKWETLEDRLNGSEAGDDGFVRCHFWIQAPPGKKISVEIEEVPFNLRYEGCTYAGVEIKTHPDQRRTGYRFCSKSSIKTTLTSNSSMVPVITYKLKGFGEEEEQEDYSHYEDYESEENNENDVDNEEGVAAHENAKHFGYGVKLKFIYI